MGLNQASCRVTPVVSAGARSNVALTAVSDAIARQRQAFAPAVLRMPVPGAVWGRYPQRDESSGDRAVLRSNGLQVQQITRSVLLEISQSGDAANASMSTRADLARHRLSTPLIARALACVAARIQAHLGLTVYPAQVEAAAAMLNQQLVEMATGEGKSVAAAMAAAVTAMVGTPVHVLTSNDYLASRDCAQFAPVFESLGLTTAHSGAEMPESQRRDASHADICYSTARTIAFDYLRDTRAAQADPLNLNDPAGERNARLQGLCFAIVDEADSVLLDEASMPLVLAETRAGSGQRARLFQVLALARQLTAYVDFVVDQTHRRVQLLRPGRATIARLAQQYPAGTRPWINTRYCLELVEQALSALHALQRGVDYIVRDEQIVLVDATTGRPATGRQLPGQLQALLAMIEGVPVPAETESTSGLTYPRFFARYHQLAGLSGTLIESAAELRTLYGLKVHRVARHYASRTADLGVRLFETRNAQFEAAAKRAIAVSRSGRPVLIGTDSVADSQMLCGVFKRTGQSVVLLNADNDRDEALQIAQAGSAGQITVSTQIAGRGTDIRPEAAALAAGGLHVLNLQHNRSARIDRQLTGRAARQGQPGSFEHWLRLADSPLHHQRLPTPVAAVAPILLAVGWRAGFVALAQYFWRLEDRSDRLQRLESDRRSSRRLHFSSMGNQ